MTRALACRWLLTMGWLLASALACAQGVAARTDDSPRKAALARQVLVMLPAPPAHYRPDMSYGGGYTDSALRAARRRTALALASAYGLRIDADWPMPALALDCVVMTVPADRPVPEVLQALSADRRVAWAQPMNRFELQGTQDDPLYLAQPAAAAWQLTALHQRATGRGVRVAIIDSGVQADHPDLLGQVVEQRSFVGNEAYRGEHHGTQVAGVIAALAGNGIGITGVAPGARLLALRACWEDSAPRPAEPAVPRGDLSSPAKPDLLSAPRPAEPAVPRGDLSSPAKPDLLSRNARESRCSSLSLAMALHHALGQNVRVIDLSLAGPPDRLLARLLDAAMAQGITLVAAVDHTRPDGGFPASLPGVIAVSDAPLPLRLSTPLSQPLLAPGTDIPTTTSPSGWTTVSGSSFAAAHVAGLLALMAEVAPPRQDIGAAIVRLAEGRIDVCATLARLQPGRDGHCPQTAPDEALARH